MYTIIIICVLINSVASTFFNAQRGFRQGCSLSPSLLFLLAVESLSKLISDAKCRGFFHGVNVARNLAITHLLFVDEILIFSSGDVREISMLAELLSLFGQAT